MPRLLRAIVPVLLASCAAPSALAPPTDGGGGMGGGSGTTTTIGSGGSGGSGPSDAASYLDVDAGACAPFEETFGPACLACLAASCCDVAVTCYQASDCFGYTICSRNCPPPSTDGGANPCLAACAKSYPMAEPAFGTMTGCLHTSCADTCPY